MDQINGFAFYVLGKWLDSTFLSARSPIKDNYLAWGYARNILSILLDGDARIRLNESAGAGRVLLAQYDQILADHTADPDFVLPDQRLQAFNVAWGTFEQALQLDLARAPIYFVSRKGIYSTYDLINGAQFALVPEVYSAISAEAQADLHHAGRCLAFGIWTGCGFHALRATEKVLREYYEAFLSKPPGKKTMGSLIEKLRESDGEAKTLAVLDQIRALHRNPVNHPEVFLSEAEAMELFQICIAAISACARQAIKARTAKAALSSATNAPAADGT